MEVYRNFKRNCMTDPYLAPIGSSRAKAFLLGTVSYAEFSEMHFTPHCMQTHHYDMTSSRHLEVLTLTQRSPRPSTFSLIFFSFFFIF